MSTSVGKATVVAGIAVVSVFVYFYLPLNHLRVTHLRRHYFLPRTTKASLVVLHSFSSLNYFRQILGDVHLHKLRLLSLVCQLGHVVDGVLRAFPDFDLTVNSEPLHPLLSSTAVLSHGDDLLVSLLVFEGLSDEGGVVGAILVLQSWVEAAVSTLTMGTGAPQPAVTSNLHLGIAQFSGVQLGSLTRFLLHRPTVRRRCNELVLRVTEHLSSRSAPSFRRRKSTWIESSLWWTLRQTNFLLDLVCPADQLTPL